MTTAPTSIAVERTIWINAPRERVWRAVTDPQQIAKWWQHDWEIPALEVGGIVKFGFDDEVVIAKIAALDPPREFAIEWPPHPGYHAIPVISRFLLSDENGGTRVTVTDTDYGPLSADERQKRIADNLEGYRIIFNNLRAYVEGETALGVQRAIWIRAPRERVWQAITDSQQITKWWGDYWHIESLQSGALVKFGPEDDQMIAIIAVLDPPHEFVITWPPQEQYHNVPMLMRYLLAEENGGTRVIVTETGFEALPEDIRQKRIDLTAAGYRTVLQGLRDHVEAETTIGVERSIWINAPIQRAWQAVTTPRDLDQWYATHFRWEIPSLEQGATLIFNNKQDGTEALRATIEILDPPHELALRWQHDSTYPDLQQITHFILSEENGGTRFVIRETGYEGVPADQRQEWLDTINAGYLGSAENLKSLLETGKLIHS